MNNELTMEQMESTSGGNPVVVGLAVVAVSSGAASFYINWYKNV